MADEEMLVGFSYEGDGQLQQFLNALDVVPKQVEEVLGRLESGSTPGNRVMRNMGEQVAQEYVKGLQAGLAGFEEFQGEGFGAQVLRQAGASEASIRRQVDLQRLLNRERDRMVASGDPAALQKRFTQETLLGVRGIGSTAEQVRTQVARVNAELQKARENYAHLRGFSGADGRVEVPRSQMFAGNAADGVTWHPRMREFFREIGAEIPSVPQLQTGGLPTSAGGKLIQETYDRMIIAARQQVESLEGVKTRLDKAPLLSDERSKIEQATAPIRRAEPRPGFETLDRDVRQGLQQFAQPTWEADRARREAEQVRIAERAAQREEIVRRRALGDSQRTVAGDLGITRHQVRKVDAELGGDIDILRQRLAGGSQRGVAGELGITRHQVRRVDATYGVGRAREFAESRAQFEQARQGYAELVPGFRGDQQRQVAEASAQNAQRREARLAQVSQELTQMMSRQAQSHQRAASAVDQIPGATERTRRAFEQVRGEFRQTGDVDAQQLELSTARMRARVRERFDERDYLVGPGHARVGAGPVERPTDLRLPSRSVKDGTFGEPFHIWDSGEIDQYEALASKMRDAFTRNSEQITKAVSDDQLPDDYRRARDEWRKYGADRGGLNYIDTRANIDWETGRRLAPMSWSESDMAKDWRRSMGLQRPGDDIRRPADQSWWENQFATGEMERVALRRGQDPSVFRPTFRESFSTGFSGPDGVPMGEMVGQTARISLFYGVAYRAFFAIQDAIKKTVDETLAYEQALTDLNVVTRRSSAENAAMATDLAKAAVTAGYAPSAGVALGSSALGLYGVAQAPQEEQERTLVLSAEVATRMARLSGGDPAATQTQLAGTLRSLGWGVERLPELEDMVTYIARNTGQGAMELLGAVANISTLGTSAGFTPEQLLAIVAQVGTTTGQNPEATAGQFRQLMSRQPGQIAPRAGEIFGEDFSGMTVAEIFGRVGQIGGTEQQLGEFSQLFGKGGSQQVAMLMAQHWGSIENLAGESLQADGLGQEAFKDVMGAVGNEIRALGATFGEFGVTLMQTGLADWIMLVISASRQLLDAGTAVIEFFNMLPRPLRSVALALAEIYGAAVLVQRMKIGGVAGRMAAGLIGTRASDGVAAVPGLLQRPFGETMARARGGLARTFAPGGPLRREGGGLTGLGWVGAAAAAAVVASVARDAYTRVSEGREALGEARSASASASTTEEMFNAAAQARNVASQIAESQELRVGDVAGLIPALIARASLGDERAEASRMASWLEAEARRQEQLEADARRSPDTVFMGDLSAEGIDIGLQALADQGYTASEQLAALTKAMRQFKEVAGETEALYAIRPEQIDQAASRASGVGGQAIEKVREDILLQEEAMKAQIVPSPNAWLERRMIDMSGRFKDPLEALELPVEVQEAMRDGLNEVVAANLQAFAEGGIDDSEMKQIVEAAQAEVLRHLEDIDGYEDAKKGIETWVYHGLVREFSELFGEDGLSVDIGAILPIALAKADEARAFAQMESGSDVYAMTSYIAELENIANSHSAESDDDIRHLHNLQIRINEAKRQLSEMLMSQAKSLVEYEKAFLLQGDVFGAAQLDQGFWAGELSEAQAGMDRSTLDVGLGLTVRMPSYAYWEDRARDAEVGLHQAFQQQQQENVALRQARAQMVSPGDSIGVAAGQLSSINIAMSSGLIAQDSSEYAQLALQRVQAGFSYRQAVAQGQSASAMAAIDPRATTSRIVQEIENARRELGLYASRDPQAGQLRDRINGLRVQLAEAVVNEANAARLAGIAGSRSTLSQAEVAIENARATLSTQLRGTEGYYTALAGLRQAQSQLAQEQRAQADRMRRLGSDITDPVEQARLDVQQARQQLRADERSGEGADVIAQSQLDLKSAQSQEEAAAFQQRISDVQVAEDLGRISHSQYMNYLSSERDRLVAIGDRTRQQQEQLNQVEQLMKAASEQMQGMWNIGDIQLPTIYEVRRAIGAGAPTQVADYSNSHNVINIDGANFDQLVAWISEFVGPSAQVVRATAPRKV